MKICPKCYRCLSDDNYNKDSKTKDGLYYCCNDCKKLIRRIYYLEHSDEICRKTNKYRKQHLDKSIQYSKSWRKRNPEKYKAGKRRYESTRRAKKRQIKNNFTTDEWLELRNSTEGICLVCGENVGIKNLTIDHIIPISRVPIGFIYTIKDIQPLCIHCNSKKHNKIQLGVST